MYRMSQKSQQQQHVQIPAPAGAVAAAAGALANPAEVESQKNKETFDSESAAGKNRVKQQQSSPGELVYIYSETCGWCERFNPIWQDFVDRYSGPLKPVKIEARQPEAAKFDVPGYPMVIVVKGGEQVAIFEDDRTVEKLLAFAQKNE
jgi:thioredoxin-like negative regulator of GroEL